MSKELKTREERGIVTPADADAVLEMIQAFEYFKSKVLTPRDFAEIQGKPWVKKSGWSKYALACNVSTELRDERIEERDGCRIYHFTYRAVHLPSGRFADAVGSASEAEKKEWAHPEHDPRALAQTRAFNRSVSNLVGGGEVSAEEMEAPESQRPRKSVESERVKRIKEQAKRDREEQLAKREAPQEGPPGNVEEVRERIARHILGFDEWIVVSEREDYFRVGKQKRLGEEMEYTVDELVRRMGGDWDKDANCWKIPKEAEG